MGNPFSETALIYSIIYGNIIFAATERSVGAIEDTESFYLVALMYAKQPVHAGLISNGLIRH